MTSEWSEDHPTPTSHQTSEKERVQVPDAVVSLVLLHGGLPGRSYPIQKELLIGRGPQVNIMLSDPEVSRCHAKVWQTMAGEYVVEDLGSRNGTFVNEIPVKKRIMTFGDQIQIATGNVLALTHQWPQAEQIIEQKKLEGMSRLAAGVAHEFNNMFAVFRACFDHLVDRSGTLSPSDMRACLDDMDTTLNRAEDFTRQLMGFAQRAKMNSNTVNMMDVIKDVIRYAHNLSAVKISATVDPHLNVLGDRPQLHQVIMNLVMNAIDAMPDGGKLTISATRRSTVDFEMIHGPAVEIAVTDTGAGMTPETIDRIFEPFFTTTAGGKKPGLGMAFTHGIIKGHGGDIEVESEPGKGTTIRILLPLVQVNHEATLSKTQEAMRVDFTSRPSPRKS